MTERYAIVTGAGRGSGLAVAEALGRAGFQLALVDINPDAAERAAARAGAQAAAHVFDVSNKMALQTALYTLLETWPRFDLLVNAARVVPHSPALKLDEWEWNRVLDVNLKGAFLISQTTARAMQATGGGVIVNLVRPLEDPPHAAVRAAREALLGLTPMLDAEWSAFGVRVHAVETGAGPEPTAARVLALVGE